MPESEWDKQTFDDAREGAEEGTKITLLDIMSGYEKEASIIAEEYDG